MKLSPDIPVFDIARIGVGQINMIAQECALAHSEADLAKIRHSVIDADPEPVESTV